MLHYIVIFSTLLMMAVKVRAQCERPAVGENRIMIEGTENDTFPEGSTIKFGCSPGYVPLRATASRSITCTGTQWSELELQCKKKSCGNPGEILSGKYLFQPTDAILFGAVLTAVCNEGYQLVGNPNRNCRENGWDGRAPICEVVKCLPPSTITDGEFEPEADIYDYGEGVEYSCKSGFDRIGPSLLKCSSDGTFQPAPPQCLSVSCERPEILNAVRIEGKSPPYKYRDFVRYQCNKGYTMEGSDLLICTEKGWDPPPPQCTAQCERPAVGENRIMIEGTEKDTFPEGSTIKFGCSTGYVPLRATASRSITCTGTQWSELELQCKKRPCGNPGEIPNGKYQYQPTDAVLFGAVIEAKCLKGYQLVGDPIRNCRENGWDGRPPTCEAVRCLPPPSIKDGAFEPEKEDYDYEDGVTYSCKKGLELIGAQLLTCSDNGTFQPAPPRCLRVSCDKPEILHAYRIEGKSPPYKYRDFVRYQCNKGYRMEGSDHLICTEKGWDPPPPQCTVITCVNPPNITNGVFNPKKELYEYEQIVTYSCDEGFKLIGDSSILCTLEGKFEPLLSQCLPITCDSPVISNGVLNGSLSSYKYNDHIQISCNEGYKINGSSILTCKEHGWSASLPRCSEVTCNAPEIPGAFIFGGKASFYKYKSSLQIQCNKGYEMEGSALLTCKKNGWNPPPPKCNIVTCLPPPPINNGQFNHPKQLYDYGQTVIYSCNKGFKLEGDSERSCTEYGRFDDPPQCLVVTCDEPNIVNGFIGDNSKFYVYKSSVRVQCNSGYQMKGSDYLTCEENGWNPPPPECHSNNNWIWILLTVIILILLCCAVFCYMKYRKRKESSHGLWAEGTDDGML